MGSNLEKNRKTSSLGDTRKKSKGERLGWQSISEYKAVSLKEVVGKGTIVCDSCSATNINAKLIP